MPQRPETPLKDLAGTLRTIIRSNKAAAEALVQIQEIETLAEDRLRPLLPELRVIKDDALDRGQGARHCQAERAPLPAARPRRPRRRRPRQGVRR